MPTGAFSVRRIFGTVNGFYYQINDLVTLITDPEDDLLVFRNVEEIEAMGLEFGLEGTIDPGPDGAVFAECITGTRVPVSRGRDYSSFARQYRHIGAGGSPAFVEFEGRFRWRADGAPDTVVIERFITVRPDGQCA